MPLRRHKRPDRPDLSILEQLRIRWSGHSAIWPFDLPLVIGLLHAQGEADWRTGVVQWNTILVAYRGTRPDHASKANDNARRVQAPGGVRIGGMTAFVVKSFPERQAPLRTT